MKWFAAIIFILLLNPAFLSGEYEEYNMNYKEDIPVVEIKAKTDFEYGLKEGKFLKEYYGDGIKALYNAWKEKVVTMEKEAKQHVKTLQKYYPSFLERLQGLSDALCIPLLHLVALDLMFPSIFMKKDACTSAAIAAAATKDNQTYISWNIDVNYLYKIIFSRYLSPPPLIICNITGKYKYVKFGILPSIFGFGFLNEKGLAYAAAMVEVNDTGEGLTSLELNNLAMETCSSVDEVKELYGNAERRSGIKKLDTAFGLTSNMNTLWVDEKEAMLIEYTHNYFAFKKGILLAETNHHQLLDANLTGAPKNDGTFMNTSSFVRLKRAYELLNEYNGSIDIDFLMKVFTVDHKKGYMENKRDLWDICRHSLNTPHFPWDLLSYFYGTACVVIIQPREYVAYYCPGHPCWMPFKKLDFKDELG